VVEREIYFHHKSQYVESHPWNQNCRRDHAAVFARMREDIPRLAAWINERFSATLYEDAYSPFCMIAESNGDADRIQAFLEDYCRKIPPLAFVRNDVYARFSHTGYNKGTALGEIARQLGVRAEHVFAAGDHLNDIPMLSEAFAGLLTAPDNAVPQVKDHVSRQEGYISHQPWGHGVARGLEFYLEKSGWSAR